MGEMVKRPFMLGIAGGSGSGKTHLARQVVRDLGEANASLLSMDQYFRSPEPGMDPRDINFDHPAHLDFDQMCRDLETLRAGERAVSPSYDFRTMCRTGESLPIEPTSVVVVEGLFVLAKPMVDMLDVTVFLDVDADQRLLGRILRDTRERGSNIIDLVDRYQRFVRPSYDVFVAPTRQNADIVVDFTYRRELFDSMLILLLRSFVEGRLEMTAFVQALRAEGSHFGFTPRNGSMPATIDIRKLAQAYPESESSDVTMK